MLDDTKNWTWKQRIIAIVFIIILFIVVPYAILYN